MSYNDESEPQSARQQSGAEPTEAYQATTEWDAMPEQDGWVQSAEGEAQEPSRRPIWEQHDDQDGWDPAAQEEWEPSEVQDGAGGGVKQSISAAADKITRWFAGLDRRPEYEDQVRDAGPVADPVAELTPDPAPSERVPNLAARERGASPSRLAAASRAAAANRRRSVAAGRDGASSSGAFSRGSAHAGRKLRGGGDRDRRPPELPPVDDQVDEPLPELMGGDGSARFPVAPLGYSRQVVDEQFADLESEVMELREALAQASHGEAPMSIQEELERIGEETASILVVAHDKAHETTRMAQEQAERCVADAAANAVAITEEATRKLQELEAETDGVRRHRERLIADVRNISGSLQSLADDAERRFAETAPAAAEPEVDAEPQTEVRAQGEPAMYGPATQ